MKIFNKLLAFTFAVMIFSIAEVNAQSFSDKPSALMIEHNVRQQILRLPYYELFDHIGFTVDDGKVTLFGKVRNGSNKDQARRIVEKIDGVTSVVNNIEILPPGRFDDTIRRDLYRSIAGTAGLSRYISHINPPVRLIVERGHVTLEGYVANKADFNLMNIRANGVNGVFTVTNNLVIDKDQAE